MRRRARLPQAVFPSCWCTEREGIGASRRWQRAECELEPRGLFGSLGLAAAGNAVLVGRVSTGASWAVRIARPHQHICCSSGFRCRGLSVARELCGIIGPSNLPCERHSRTRRPVRDDEMSELVECIVGPDRPSGSLDLAPHCLQQEMKGALKPAGRNALPASGYHSCQTAPTCSVPRGPVPRRSKLSDARESCTQEKPRAPLIGATHLHGRFRAERDRGRL